MLTSLLSRISPPRLQKIIFSHSFPLQDVSIYSPATQDLHETPHPQKWHVYSVLRLADVHKWLFLLKHRCGTPQFNQCNDNLSHKRSWLEGRRVIPPGMICPRTYRSLLNASYLLSYQALILSSVLFPVPSGRSQPPQFKSSLSIKIR